MRKAYLSQTFTKQPLKVINEEKKVVNEENKENYLSSDEE